MSNTVINDMTINLLGMGLEYSDRTWAITFPAYALATSVARSLADLILTLKVGGNTNKQNSHNWRAPTHNLMYEILQVKF